MYDDGYRRRTNLHSGRQTSKISRKSLKISLIGFQIIVSLLCVAVAVVIKLIGGSVYTAVRSEVSKTVNYHVTSSDVSQALATIKKGLPNMSDVFSGSSSSKTASQSSGSSSSTVSNSSSASSSGTLSASSTASSKASSSSQSSS
jgi:hypothetical protein